MGAEEAMGNCAKFAAACILGVLGSIPHGAAMAADLVILTNQGATPGVRSEEHTSELQSRFDLVCRLLLEKKKNKIQKQRGVVCAGHGVSAPGAREQILQRR